MPEPFTERLDGGVVTSREPTGLSAGELQAAIGCWYKPSDSRLHAIRGNSTFGDTGSGAKVKGVRLLQFDSGGTDRLVALSGTTLYSATPGATGTFSSLKTGMDSTANRLSAAQYADRWYLTTDGDADSLFVIENDGTTYDAGMQPYSVAPTISKSAAGGAVIRPASPSGTILSPANTVDADTDSFGAIVLAAAGSEIVTWTWSSGASAARDLIVKWALQGAPVYGDIPFHDRPRDSGATADPGFNVTLKLEFSSDNGGAYTTVFNGTFTQTQAPRTLQVSAGTVDPAATNCILRATLTYNSGKSQAAWRFYDSRLQTGASGTNFSTTTGMYYGLSEYDQIRGERSSVKAITDLVTLATQNQVTITRPTQKNSRATHWEVWRTSDGGAAPFDLGLLATIPISQTTYKDDFEEYPSSTSPPFKLPMLQITVDGGTLLVDRDQPPPSMDRVFSYKGSLLGIKGRTLRYSLGGLPGSWPEVYGISAFESDEHDTLKTGVDMGEFFLLAGVANLRRIQALPRVAIGNFSYAAPELLAAAPGVVGPYAMTKFSVTGEPRAAWISHYGVYTTNGYGVQRISDDWDWSGFEGFDKSNWVLAWDPERFVLVLAYSTTSGGANSKYALAHMHPTHQKPSGQPKWTIGHTGAFNDLAVGQVGNRRRMYSAHPSNGIVYLEDSGTVVATTVTPRRLQGAGSEFAVTSAWLRHGAFGTGDVTVSWSSGRDSTSDPAQTRTATVDVSSDKRSLFDVSLGGDWHEATMTHAGGGPAGWISDLVLLTRPLGGSGTVKVA